MSKNKFYLWIAIILWILMVVLKFIIVYFNNDSFMWDPLFYFPIILFGFLWIRKDKNNG